MKKIQPELHDEIFGQRLVEHSNKKSLNFFNFSLFSKNWERFSDERLLFFMKVNRLVSISFLLIIVGKIFYVLVAGFIDVASS